MSRLLILPLFLSACAHVQTLPRADGGGSHQHPLPSEDAQVGEV